MLDTEVAFWLLCLTLSAHLKSCWGVKSWQPQQVVNTSGVSEERCWPSDVAPFTRFGGVVCPQLQQAASGCLVLCAFPDMQPSESNSHTGRYCIGSMAQLFPKSKSQCSQGICCVVVLQLL